MNHIFSIHIRNEYGEIKRLRDSHTNVSHSLKTCQIYVIYYLHTSLCNLTSFVYSQVSTLEYICQNWALLPPFTSSQVPQDFFIPVRMSSNTPQRAPFFTLGLTETDSVDNQTRSPTSSNSDSSSDDTGYLADDELSDRSTSVDDRLCDTDNLWWCLITECLKGQRDA